MTHILVVEDDREICLEIEVCILIALGVDALLARSVRLPFEVPLRKK